MSLKAVAARLLHNGRILLRSLYPGKSALDSAPAIRIGVESRCPNAALNLHSGRASVPPPPPSSVHFGRQVHAHVRRFLVDSVLNRVTNSLSAQLRRNAARRLLFGDPAPFFALVGVSLASGSGILTKEDEMEGICWEIREAVSKLPWMQKKAPEMPAEVLEANDEREKIISLKDLEIGPSIAKGCSAVVYAGRWKQDEPSEEAAATENQPPGEKNEQIDAYPLAVKMMFNYSVESNALSILRNMHRETIPAQAAAVREMESWEESLQSRKRWLPPHPNIVDMQCVFADQIPSLPDSMALYPDALPLRLNPTGSGHNMSLFLVMKKYDCSLQNYLREKKSLHTAVLLLAQLLEGVAHVNRNQIAHRDLKSDNILIDLSLGEDAPIVAITDFGCCLADRVHGLSLPYHTPETEKGGNPALMAPEVACALPGPFTSINYSKSDAWTVGALAYEIFGCSNPFYLGPAAGKGRCLDSRSYSEEDLPPLPEEVPEIIRVLVQSLLERNPTQRLSAEEAATVCQLFLWAPNIWLSGGYDEVPTSTEVMQWLLCLTTKMLYESVFPHTKKGSKPLLEYRLVATFLKRVKLNVVLKVLKWLHHA